MNKIDSNSDRAKSLDIKLELKTKILELLPECNSDGDLNVAKLLELLSEESESGAVNKAERYEFNWAGKKAAVQLALSSSNATLRPNKEASVNWEQSGNLFIEGDNLEVLKLLQKSYHKSVKMIYIDPPYNTGKDFIYSDSFSETISNYLEQTHQLSADGKKTSTNVETSGRYHSNWLSMMYPRLRLARNMLSDDGVIVIHLDENENYHLRMLMNEIYGEDNFLGEICWDKGNPKGDSSKIAYQHESILVFSKDINTFKENNTISRPKENAEKMLSKAKSLYSKIGSSSIPAELKKLNDKYSLGLDLSEHKKTYAIEDVREEFKTWVSKQSYLSGGEAAYNKIDENGEVYRTVSMAWPNKKKAPDDYFIPLLHPVTQKSCPVPDRGWRNPPETMASLLSKGLVVFGEDESKQPERKYLLKENMYENVPSVLKFSGSDDALLKKMNISFDNPKPVDFASKLISYFTKENDLILDFFAGSGTTGHAALKLSQQSSRRFILVQLPEPIAGGGVISNTTTTRLKSVENVEVFGFKSFRLDETNIRPWDADFDNLEQMLQQAAQSIKSDRTSEDVLYEILLKYGYSLTTKVEEKTLNDKAVFVVASGALIACLEDEVTSEVVEDIAKLATEFGGIAPQIVFKDQAFADDTVKANAIQILKQTGISDVKSI
ncbi:site-specific DNA-methyltransferase [Vibrio sonorensis]|uniref:site-specific DNA-methyltransferase n=1 Tax=Vibrio sonorensis TaxID=1004316 RepID=UPI0008DA716E|nr:site-specific DNA-methyltransferase [Vibrio sonorensis]